MWHAIVSFYGFSLLYSKHTQLGFTRIFPSKIRYVGLLSLAQACKELCWMFIRTLKLIMNMHLIENISKNIGSYLIKSYLNDNSVLLKILKYAKKKYIILKLFHYYCIVQVLHTLTNMV